MYWLEVPSQRKAEAATSCFYPNLLSQIILETLLPPVAPLRLGFSVSYLSSGSAQVEHHIVFFMAGLVHMAFPRDIWRTIHLFTWHRKSICRSTYIACVCMHACACDLSMLYYSWSVNIQLICKYSGEFGEPMYLLALLTASYSLEMVTLKVTSCSLEMGEAQRLIRQTSWGSPVCVLQGVSAHVQPTETIYTLAHFWLVKRLVLGYSTLYEEPTLRPGLPLNYSHLIKQQAWPQLLHLGWKRKERMIQSTSCLHI